MSRGIRRGAGPPEHAREEIFMTVQEVAEYLNCHAGTVYRLVRQREIPCFKLGGSWRFRSSDLEQWIRDRQQKAEDAGGLFEGGREDKRRGSRPKAGEK